VTDDDIDAALDVIARETRETFEFYDVPLDEERAVIEVVQTTLLETVVQLGEFFDDRTVIEQFESLVEDLSETGSSSARSNIVYALSGARHAEDAPESIERIGGAILASNYGSSHDTEGDWS
jgi:hypothetical protein